MYKRFLSSFSYQQHCTASLLYWASQMQKTKIVPISLVLYNSSGLYNCEYFFNLITIRNLF